MSGRRSSLDVLIASSPGPLLLDFDGPVCSIFGGYPAPTIAAELRSLIERQGFAVSKDARGETDPMEVLRWSSTLGASSLTHSVEEALCAAELSAATTAVPDAGGHDVLLTARRIGRPVAIVSNNSAGAINAYLHAHGLADTVAYVAGRAYAEPDRMKPNPEPIYRAAAALDVEPSSCIFVGDSLFDIQASQAAHVPIIAYANKEHKIERFIAARSDVVVTRMAEISEALLTNVRTRST